MLVLVLAQGCDSRGGVGELDALATARAQWDATEPVSYSFAFTGSNPLGPLTGGGTNVVTEGVVLSTTAGPGLMGSGAGLTVEDVFARVVEALGDADQVDVTYDETYGFPATLRVDHDEDAIDDENYYTVVDFTVRQPRG